jgi:hypothetical protein
MFLVDEQFASPREEVFQGDVRQGRPMVRCPSVPLDPIQPRCHQPPYGDSESDLSIISVPLTCLSPGASWLYQ